MERRDAVKYTAMFLGAGLSASTVAAILNGCKVDTSDVWKPSFLSIDESDFLLELGETMLPRTTTPGAKDAMVNRFIDAVRPLRYTVDENKVFKHELNAFMHQSVSELGRQFLTASAEKKLAWLQSLDKATYESVVLVNGALPNDRPFYLVLKEQILAGYFSSEAVAKSYFAYDPLPGRYDPCIPYDSVGKAWYL
jgi:hypothetical protein